MDATTRFIHPRQDVSGSESNLGSNLSPVHTQKQTNKKKPTQKEQSAEFSFFTQDFQDGPIKLWMPKNRNELKMKLMPFAKSSSLSEVELLRRPCVITTRSRPQTFLI